MKMLAPRRRQGRPTVALLVLVTLLIAAVPGGAPARAQGAVTLSATAAFEGNYAPDRWLPISIVLRNDGPAAQVTLAVGAPNATFRNTLPLELAGASETRATLYAAMGREARELRVSVSGPDGVIAEQQLPVRPREGERMLGIVAAQPLQLPLPRRQDLAELPFLAFNLAPSDLPAQPAGLSSLSLLLLSGVAGEQLQPAQLDALTAWVRNGGHLLLGGGPGAAATVAGLPPELRAAELGDLGSISPAALADYAGSPAPAQIEGLRLSPAPDAQALGEPGAPLWAQRDVGLGRVTQLAFDPGLRAIAEWPGAAAMWDRLLRPAAIYGVAFGSDPFPDLIREQIIAGALGNLPAVSLPDSNPLFALLALYAVLIGPGMALLLRRLDRQSLGWVALPGAALLVFLVGSGIALAGRADQRLISQVSLVEQVDADSARARTALGILSPRQEEFALDLSPQALVRPAQPVGSQYGPVEPAGGDLSQASGAMRVAVEPWSLRGLLVEDMVALPALDAEIALSAAGVEAVVRNTTEVILRDVAVAYAGQVVSLGTLAPGAEARGAWPPAEAEGGRAPLSTLVLGEELAEARQAGGQIDRRLQIREALINAAVGRGSLAEEAGPFVLAWPDRSPLELDVTAEGAARQQISLLVARPRIGGAGQVRVPAGWMRLQPAADGRPSCDGPLGAGLQAGPAPVVLTLALPADLAGLRAGALSLELQSERDWPNSGVTTEIYNWERGSWDEIDFDGPGSLLIREAGPYLAGGRTSVRLGGRIDQAGCVFASAQMSGELPAQP